MCVLLAPVLVAIALFIGGGNMIAPSARSVAAPFKSCASALTGRRITVPPRQDAFGSAQRLPPLPLKAGEYVLTIDDGPDRTSTPVLLDLLRQNCVHATFFLIGRRATATPDLAKRIVAEGNGIGSHSQNHRNFSGMSLDQVRDEIVDGADSVERAVYGRARSKGERRLMRLPGGPGVPLIPPQPWRAIARDNGLILAGVDASPEDWRNDPPDVSFKRLLGRLPDRGVILLHDGQSNTPALLRMILSEMARRRAKIVTLD